MDLKTRIQRKIQELSQSNKFLLNNPRYVKFINDLFILTDKNGRLPIPTDISTKLRIKISKIYYMREMLQKNMAWPFLGFRSCCSRSVYVPDITFTSKDMSFVNEESLPIAEEYVDLDLSARIEAARKAKREKWGKVVKNKDIEKYL